jgi:hypothetical protein
LGGCSPKRESYYTNEGRAHRDSFSPRSSRSCERDITGSYCTSWTDNGRVSGCVGKINRETISLGLNSLKYTIEREDVLKLRSFLFSTILLMPALVIPSGFIIPNQERMNRSAGIQTLDTILEKTADYCERVKDIALFYVYKEKVEDERYFFSNRNLLKFSEASSDEIEPRRMRKKTYTYDYQLIKKEKEPREKRILLEEDGKEKYEENVEFRPVKYFGKYLVYGAVGFLSRQWQPRFEYKIVGQDVVEGKKTIVIESFPKEEREENCNYGRIWVDEKDSSILKIEYDPRSIKGFEDEMSKSPVDELRRTVVWYIFYGIEKHGVRFPSQQLIQEFYVNGEGERILLEKISFNYEDYKFFVVETEVKY